ncbi:MAG: DUF1588 domain-containing protein [Planctomycetota bacterium]|nr:DUF1588 domain-containing protein [Planctomycetota bacterium]
MLRNRTTSWSFRVPILGACWLATLAAVADEDRTAPVRNLLVERCTGCHDGDARRGGLNLVGLLAGYDPWQDREAWIKVEVAIKEGKMPPAGETPLSPAETEQFQGWFGDEFVTPGGVQHAGLGYPRRLTREELQNTLEDLLHVQIRETVTNSRLHVIPDNVIEKFFPPGVLGASGFSNDARSLSKGLVDIQTSARCLGRVLALLDANAKARRMLFGQETLPDDLPVAEAQEILRKFGQAAYRRTMTPAELAAIVDVYRQRVTDHSPYEAIKSAYLATLLSPSFLFRFERPDAGQTPVVGEELAVRLAYFLWSAPPDAELLKAAHAGTLHNSKSLVAHVRRMLADPKRVALAENLGGEWFDYKPLRQQSAVNKRSDKMAGFFRTQYEEALLFFDSLIRFDQPLFRIVDADWGFLNRHQAGIYRIQTEKKVFEGVTPLPPINIHYRNTKRGIANGNYEYKHAPLALVRWTDPNRGGLVTLGSTMSVTSTENRTSPIRRGVWVMERILGVHFEIPKDVPDLETTQKKAESQRLNLTHNEILRLHSAQPGCSSCHQYIDPIGFGLETFDQLGIGRAAPAGEAAGEVLRWTPAETPKTYADHTWTLVKPVATAQQYRIRFQWTKGRHRLDIRKVRLRAGGVTVEDKHFGFTGNRNRENTWVFPIPADAPQEGWKLTAEIQGNGGTDSYGSILVSGPNDRGKGYRLPNGHTFSTPSELKQLLLSDYRDKIVDNVVHRVLAYALGRKIDPVDRPAIKKIKESIGAREFRMQALIEAVVLSYPFRHKENR